MHEQLANDTRPFFWPVVLLLPTLVIAVLYPVAFLACLLLVCTACFGFRYPIATASAVLVSIPVIDQAVADKEFLNVFGAIRLTPAVVLKAMASLVIGVYLVRRRINPFRYRMLRPLLLWLTFLLLSCFLFHDRALALSMWFRLAYWVAYLVFFFVVACECDQGQKDVKCLWRAGVIAIFIFTASVLIAKAMNVGGEYYHVGESYGFYSDPWNMAMTLPGGLVLALLYPSMFGEKSFAVKLGCVVLSGMTVLAAFFTMTRTSLIACLVALLIVTFALRRVMRSRMTRVLFIAACIAVTATVFIVYRNIGSSDPSNEVSARWSEVDKGDIASGRLEVFYAAWNKFASASPMRKLVGYGIGAGPEAAEEFTGVYVYLHDDFLEMLICSGIIGVALYCWWFVSFYRAVLWGLSARCVWAVAALTSLGVYSVTSISYMRIYAVTPNTYFALAVGTSLGMLHHAASQKESVAIAAD